MYNHLPKIDPTRSLDGPRRPSRSEEATMRRMHREQVAAERALQGEPQPGLPSAARRIARPVALLIGLVGTRR